MSPAGGGAKTLHALNTRNFDSRISCKILFHYFPWSVFFFPNQVVVLTVSFASFLLEADRSWHYHTGERRGQLWSGCAWRPCVVGMSGDLPLGCLKTPGVPLFVGPRTPVKCVEAQQKNMAGQRKGKRSGKTLELDSAAMCNHCGNHLAFDIPMNEARDASMHPLALIGFPKPVHLSRNVHIFVDNASTPTTTPAL